MTNAANAPVMLIITPIANPPEFANAILACAIIPKPVATINTPIPSIIVLFAIVRTDLLLTFADFPVAVSPAATPNNFAASPAIPFPANARIDFVKLPIPGASAFTILNALNPINIFGNVVIRLAIAPECFSAKPANSRRN